MLRGIKERAEGRPLIPAAWTAAAQVGWALAAAAVLGLFVNRRLGPWLLLPMLFAVPAAVLAHDRDAALAAFIGSGAIALGTLLFGSRARLVSAVVASAALLLSMVAPFGVTLFGAIAWGRRWTAFVLLTCAVLLVFLFSPDAYTTFGVLFDLTAVVAIGVGLNRLPAGAARSFRRLHLQPRHI